MPRLCTSCGAAVSDDAMRFCLNCGTPLAVLPAPVAASASPSVARASGSQPAIPQGSSPVRPMPPVTSPRATGSNLVAAQPQSSSAAPAVPPGPLPSLPSPEARAGPVGQAEWAASASAPGTHGPDTLIQPASDAMDSGVDEAALSNRASGGVEPEGRAAEWPITVPPIASEPAPESASPVGKVLLVLVVIIVLAIVVKIGSCALLKSRADRTEQGFSDSPAWHLANVKARWDPVRANRQDISGATQRL